ncbi:glycerophosphoryl diester phosphodiesterase membrane domain-containing protein [Microbacterium insulae]|uniref:Glycerophosphoryl diester phosphodiesterase membrane domain-containing protein n=1 Tax=Microbacterium insulae TaxID=483014 RepID=A0ABW3AE40_9MICO
MTAQQAWTPASRPGIIPLHPLSFGMLLGRSFAALRSNPRVLLGFALVVQTVTYIVVLAAVVGIAFASFVRLDTLQPGTDEYNAVLAGSIAITAIAGLVLGLAAGALGVLVQGIVVTEVAHAAVAERLTLGALWRQVKPIAWRLIGYSALVILVIVAAIAVVATAAVALGAVTGPVAIVLVVLLIIAAIPLSWWLMIKLLLVPAAIILERATIGRAIARSWALTRGRFWSSLGVIFLISMIFGFVAQAVSIPFSLLGSGLTTIIAPTGDPEPSAIIGVIAVSLFTQVITLLIQSVALVVQSTATALIYIDCRMRREGLDLDLLAYVERRDAGATDLPDPYRANVGRALARPTYGAAPAYPAPGPYAPPYGQQPYAQQPYGQPQYGQPQYAQPYGAPPQVQPPYAPAPAPAAPPATSPDAPSGPAAPPPTTWAAPGTPSDGVDRESPWA